MDVDAYLKTEALSSLFGRTLRPSQRLQTLTLDDCFHSIVSRKQQPATYGKLFIDVEDYFDPKYDYDFTNLSDFSKCWRGGEDYTRPRGWYRIALKVRGKYPGGNTWLGPKGWRSYSADGEWPVSYHGTSYDGANGIVKGYYRAGSRRKFGRGIYSTPDLDEAESYSKIFTSSTRNKNYKVIMQNRINPDFREICQQSDYWLIPIPAGTSAKAERAIVKESIRPYGILIKEV